MASGGSVSDPPPVELLPQAVSERVRSGELLLRVNKKSKGSHAWDQFCLVWIQLTIKKYVVLLVVACANRVFVIKCQ